MRLVFRLTLFSLCTAILTCACMAQAQESPSRRNEQPSGALKDRIIDRMMKLDKNNDGKLSKDEITDERLLRLFERADTNKDGVVSREELEALATKMAAEESSNSGRRGRFGPPGGPGGPGDGPRRGFGGPPRPGQIFPSFLQDRLNLSGEQRTQLEALQKEVDSKLAKILTAEQKKQLEEMRRLSGPRGRGPGGPGGPPPGGPRGRGPDAPDDGGPRGGPPR